MATVSHDKPLRAVLWCAVSSEQQADEGKESLPTQESELRVVAEHEGWDIVDVLIVPGFSRRYYELSEFAAAAQHEQIDAGERLIEHFERRDFDVFACRDGSRFGRTQALLSGIVERVIDVGARIYSLADGWVDERNFRMYASMSGYSAASHVDWLRKGYEIGMPRRVSKGLPASQLPMSHIVERDKAGKAVRTVINEPLRRLFDDAAQMLLEGVGWGDMGLVLFEQFGHANPKNGKPYSPTTFRNIFYSPWIWGHSARLYVRTSGKKPHYQVKKTVGLWAFDEDEPLPDGAEVYRNTVPPLFKGDLADQIKAELRRRVIVLEGRAGHQNANMFTGLLVCDLCGCRLSYRKNAWRSYRCMSIDSAHRYHPRSACVLEKRTIGEQKVKAWIHARLDQMLAKQDPLVFQQIDDPSDYVERADKLRSEIADVETRIAGLMVQRTDTPVGSQHILNDLIVRFDQQLQGLRAARHEAEAKTQQAQKLAGSTNRAFEAIQALGLEAFWTQTPGDINRLLHMLLGDNRLVVLDGEIIGKAQQARYADVV